MNQNEDAHGTSKVVSKFVYRGRTEIIASVLEGAREGKSKTHLMYAANLDFRGLKKYLEYLISKDFVEREEDEPYLYRTTSKGLDFLTAYNSLRSVSA